MGQPPHIKPSFARVDPAQADKAGAPETDSALRRIGDNLGDSTGKIVGLPVSDRVDRPCDEVLAYGPYLADHLAQGGGNPDGGDKIGEDGTVGVYIKLSENERRGLRVGLETSVGGNLWDVFFSGDRE